MYSITLFVPKNDNKAIIWNKILSSETLKAIKPGDLILFSAHKFNVVTRTFGHRVFSHIGIIVRLRKRNYIYEVIATDLSNPKSNDGYNTALSPYEERISTYDGNAYVASLVSRLSKSQTSKLWQFATTQKFKFCTQWKMPFRMFSTSLTKDERFCSELIAQVLDTINVTYSLLSTERYKLHSELIQLLDGVTYNKPLHIIPNDLIQTVTVTLPISTNHYQSQRKSK